MTFPIESSLSASNNNNSNNNNNNNNEDDEQDVHIFEGGRRPDVNNFESPPEDVTHVRIDAMVVQIPNKAFQHRTKLKHVEFASSSSTIGLLHVIGRDSFEGCHELTEIRLPTSIREIHSFAFAGCYKLEFVDLPEGLEILETGVFVSCISIKTLRIPSTTRTIQNHAMAFCIRLTTVILPEGLITISTRAFRQCISLMTIRIPSTVMTIQSSAFMDCKNLLSVEIAERGLLRIETAAFSNCEDLRSIYIPETVTHVGPRTFEGCTKLKEVLLLNQDDDGDETQFVSALKARFQNLPIHRMVYFHSYYPNVDTVLTTLTEIFSQEGRRRSDNDENADDENADDVDLPPPETDLFGMTPLHLMALSYQPNLEIALCLVQRYADFHTLEDRWGRLPVIYLCQTGAPNSVELVKRVARVILPAIVLTFHLKPWKAQMATYIDSLQEQQQHCCCRTRSSQIQKMLKIVDKYRTKEKLCLVELFLWKMKLQQQITTISTTTSTVVNDEEPAKKKAKTNTYQSIPNPSFRNDCRMMCGAEIVISNVVPYLD